MKGGDEKMSKLFFAGLVTLALAGAVLAQPALAAVKEGFGGRGFGRERMLETKAETLGMSVEELEGALEESTFPEIMEERGVSREELHERMGEGARARWAERGFSEEVIAERMEAREERRAARGECPADGSGGFGLRR